MLYATHKAGGAVAMLLAYGYMRGEGYLVEGIHPLMQLAIMYPSASFGSTLPDLDHHWGSVKEKTPFNYIVHKVLHLTNPKHRSWQTHSVLVTMGMCYLMWELLNLYIVIKGESTTLTLLKLMLLGLSVGVGSHLMLDAITRSGIYIIPTKKIRLVPDSSKFSTGTGWEEGIRKILIVLFIVLLIRECLVI